MSRRGENIFKRKDGRWEGRYMVGRKDNGKIKYGSVYASSYAECSEKLKKALSAKSVSKVNVTVDQLFEAWLLNRKNSIKQSTYVAYKTRYDSYIAKKIGCKRLSEVTAVMLDQLLDELLTNGGENAQGLSAETVQAVIIMLRSMFEFAEEEYELRSPANRLHPPKCVHKDIEVFTDSEIRRIKESTVVGNSMDIGIALSLFTGIRIGELCALKWADIDIKSGLISVNKTLTRIRNPNGKTPKTIVVITEPKSNKSIRQLVIPPFMLPMLRQMKCQSDFYLLTGTAKYTEPRAYMNHYKAVLKRISVPYKNFHVLRHTFATSCIRQGIDVKTVSELLGHSSVKITLEKYVHSNIDVKRKELEKMFSSFS